MTEAKEIRTKTFMSTYIDLSSTTIKTNLLWFQSCTNYFIWLLYIFSDQKQPSNLSGTFSIKLGGIWVMRG